MPTLSSAYDFMMSLGKPKLCTKFEVAIFIHCVNIEGDPKFWGTPRAMPTLSSACDFMMSLGKPQLRAKFKVASPSHCRNITREPQNFSLGAIL